MVQLMHGYRVHRGCVADPDSLSHCRCTSLVCVTPISLLPRISGFSCSRIHGVWGLRVTLVLSEDFFTGLIRLRFSLTLIGTFA
jgi:hypothetical protein